MPSNKHMSFPEADNSGEDFGPTPSSSAEDGDQSSDDETTFWPMPHSWTPEQLGVLSLRVDDWKASKNVKAQRLILQGALVDLSNLIDAPPADGLKLRIRAWYRQNTRKPPKAAMGGLPTRHKVITHVHGAEIEEAISREKPGLERGQREWMAEYSRQFGKMNRRIKSDPKEDAKIEKLRQQWMNTGPPAAVRRKDAGKTLSKRMNKFAKTMYLELGVRMVVLGAWVDPEGKKKWSMFESNNCLGSQKPNFTAEEPRWHEKPIEQTFHAYVEDYLTGDEEEKTVTRPGGSSKPKQTLETGGKGQPMLPANCLIRHGNNAQFLNYQKQVLRAFIERMYNLGSKRNSGHVPWLDIYTRQSEFINQVEYMPIQKQSHRGSSRASSSAPAQSHASTNTPGDLSDNDEDADEHFVLLRDPSKMQKHEIEACFTHWLARQEAGKIGFEFCNVLNSREGTLRTAARLEELSDLGETESNSTPPPPHNLPKRKRSRKQVKSSRRAAPSKNLSPRLPEDRLPLEWDPLLDPVLQEGRVPPQGQTVNNALGELSTRINPTGGLTATNITDPAHTAYLADIERGRMVVGGPVPAWMHNTVQQPTPIPSLRPAICSAPNNGVISIGDSTSTTAVMPGDATGMPTLHANGDTHAPCTANPMNRDAVFTGDPEPNAGHQSTSPVPDYTRRWMRTRSKSRSRHPEEPSTTDQTPLAEPFGTGETIKRKRGRSPNEGLKKSKSTKGKEAAPAAGDGQRPKPRLRVGGSAGNEMDTDTFDLRHHRAV